MIDLSEKDHLADCEYAASLRRVARRLGLREGFHLDTVEVKVESLLARVTFWRDEADAYLARAQAAETRLAEAEAYAKEGWDWLGEALDALGVKTVFEIAGAKVNREKLYMDGHAQGFEDGTEAAEADRDRYKDALEQIEWVWEQTGEDESEGGNRCPACGMTEAQRHDRSCRTAAALAASERAEEE